MHRKLTTTLKVMLALFLAVFSNGLMPATVAYAVTGGPNEDCSPGLSLIAKYEWNDDAEAYDYEKGVSPTAVTVSGDSESGAFTVATGYTVSEVIIKGGQGTTTTDGTSGTFSNIGLPEAGGSGKPAAISNIQFCGSVNIPKDAAADVNVIDPTCESNSVASVVGLANATLNGGTLDQSVGTHTAVFTADTGHHFSNGTSTLEIDYTIEAQLEGEECEVLGQQFVSPQLPTYDDQCGTESDNIVPPEDTDQIDYTLVGNTITATLKNPATHDFGEPLNGYVVAEGGASASLVVTHEFTNDPCVTPVACEVPANGGVITQESAGWSTTASAEFVAGGVEMTSTGWNDSLVTLTDTYPIAEVQNLGWTVEGEASVSGAYGIGILLELSNGAVVHYEPTPYTDDFWTNSAGVLPANMGGQGGPYSGSLQDLLDTAGNLNVVKTSFIFTSASENTITLKSLSFNCTTYIFDKHVEEEKKVWVCKYVGKPGISERLKAGENPIAVSINSTDLDGWDGETTGFFNDAQNRSYVLGVVDKTQTPPTRDDCVAGETAKNPTVVVLQTVCVDKGMTGSFTIRVTNNNDTDIEYQVVLEDNTTMTKVVPAMNYADFTFSGYGVGSYDFDVKQKLIVENTEMTSLLSLPSLMNHEEEEPTHAWTTIATGTATLVECEGQTQGETDVCPNIDGTQTMVPVGYTKDSNGNCNKVVGQVLPTSVTPDVLPATGSASFLSQWFPMIAAVLTYGITSFAQRKQRA